MKSHPRIRKTIGWGGAAVTVLLVASFFGSRSWTAIWLGSKYLMVGLAHGCLYLYWNTNSDMDVRALYGVPATWHKCDVVRSEPGLSWLGDWGDTLGIGLPLWPLLLLSIVTTVVAWRLDARARRRARGRVILCPTGGCNYDRAGIAKDAVCPECGALPPVPSSASKP